MKYLYKEGYNVLPALRKISGPVFVKDNQYDFYIAEKRSAIEKQVVFLECEAQSAYGPIVLFISHETGLSGNFSELAMQLQEDLAIHRIEGNRDWLAACHVCFPSGWWPSEKIGKSFREIHEPVPGMRLDNSFKLAKAMTTGRYERYVWSVVTEPEINFHPRFEKRYLGIYLKVERQIIIGFPEVNAALFVIRQHLYQPDKAELLAACEAMTPQQRQYKGIDLAVLYKV